MKIYFLSILCSLLVMSCKYTDENGVVVTRDGGTHLDKARWVVTTEQRLVGKDANEDAAQDSDETPVYEVSLRSYLYVVNGVVVGTGESSLREYLTRQKKGSIVFYSDYPLLMPEAESELKSIFSEQGFPVKQIFGYTSTTSASERSECSDLADEAMGKDNDETYDYMIRLYARVHLVNGVVIGETDCPCMTIWHTKKRV